MSIENSKTLLILFSLALILPFGIVAQTVKTEKEAVEFLQDRYRLYEAQRGIEEGKNLVKMFPDNIEIKAWIVRNMTRNGQKKEAVEEAKKLVENNKDNKWAMFALVCAYEANGDEKTWKESLSIIERLLAEMPDYDEFIFIKSNLFFRLKDFPKAMATIEENASKIENKSKFLMMKGKCFFESGEKDKGLATLLESVKANPNDGDAFFFTGWYLNEAKRFKEAVAPFKRAVELMPNAFFVRTGYWQVLFNSLKDKTPAESEKEVSAVIDDFIKTQKLTSRNWWDIAQKYKEFKFTEKQRAIEDEVLKRFPNTWEAEYIEIERLNFFNYYQKREDLSTEAPKFDEKKRKEYVKIAQKFLSRPKYFYPNSLTSIYSKLLMAVADDKKFSDSAFLKLAEQSFKKIPESSLGQQFYTLIPGLIKRKLYLEAEKYARIGVERFDGNLQKLIDTGKTTNERAEIDKEFVKGILLGYLGDALFRLKRFDEAEKALLESVKLYKEFYPSLTVLSELYEAKNDFENAENYYIDSLNYSQENKPNFDKLKVFYQKRNSSLDGFESHFKKIEAKAKERRKAQTITERIPPTDLPVFNLKNLDGKIVSSAELKSKVIVINVWATWCGPCVKEMPDFQQLAQKYKDSKDVVILTINSNEDIETINNFMKTKKYDFPVLMSEGYTKDDKISGLPTTWFIDKKGKIIYAKVGYSKNLIEEFEWRIEELNK